MLPADFQNPVIMLIKRIFLSRHLHPGKNNGTAPGYNIHQALIFLKALCGPAVDSYMDGHKIHSVLSVHFHNLQPFLCGNIL